jgi:hypothetical protein
MSDQFIQDDLAQFIIENIDSIAQLEALLLIRKNQETNWSAPAVARWLYIDEKQTTQLLVALCHRGFAVQREGKTSLYQYQPSSKELAQKVDQVTEIYSKHLIAVTHLIHSKPKIRIQEFADAFKFRKDSK